MRIREVDVEILREGPRHNQLLSPLTHYLGICEDFPAARIVLPESYEQASFERRMAELRYEVVHEDPARLRDTREQTGAEIGRILGGIPGLAGALSPTADDELVHLRLVLSASELARIPFELAKIPTGSGAPPDEWLALSRPVSLTRRSRGVSASRRPWGRSPRVLFVTGPDVGETFTAHRDALTRVLQPWSSWPEDGDSPLLTVVPNASLDQLAAAMRSRPTYVHVLAHGDEDLEAGSGRFGVALRDEIVSGARLASALRTVADGRLHVPTVVTLSSCDSANEGSPIPPDTSVAHALHAGGVALVVAAQFPLSVAGSKQFVDILYSGLLWGRHPVTMLYDLRTELHRGHGDLEHDWAAITAHEALPSNLGDQLEELRYWQVRRAHESALRRVEALAAEDDTEPAIEAVGELAAQFPSTGPYALECVGLRAAGSKRLAEASHRCALAAAASGDTDTADAAYEQAAHGLRQALTDYRFAADALLGSAGEHVNKKVSLHWMLTQVITISLLFDAPGSSSSSKASGRWPDEVSALWTTARLAAEVDTRRDDRADRETRAWGLVSLTELWLLRVGDGALGVQARKDASKEATQHARQLVALMGSTSEQVTNTCRQIRRYVDWWGSSEFSTNMRRLGVGVGGAWHGPSGVVALAGTLVEILGPRANGHRRG